MPALLLYNLIIISAVAVTAVIQVGPMSEPQRGLSMRTFLLTE